MPYEYQMAFGQDNGTSSSVPTHGNTAASNGTASSMTNGTVAVVSSAAAAPSANGASATPAPFIDDSQEHLMRISGRAEFHLGDLVLLGLIGAFFWWFFRRFIPGMEAAAQREREKENAS